MGHLSAFLSDAQTKDCTHNTENVWRWLWRSTRGKKREIEIRILMSSPNAVTARMDAGPWSPRHRRFMHRNNNKFIEFHFSIWFFFFFLFRLRVTENVLLLRWFFFLLFSLLQIDDQKRTKDEEIVLCTTRSSLGEWSSCRHHTHSDDNSN